MFDTVSKLKKTPNIQVYSSMNAYKNSFKRKRSLRRFTLSIPFYNVESNARPSRRGLTIAWVWMRIPGRERKSLKLEVCRARTIIVGLVWVKFKGVYLVFRKGDIILAAVETTTKTSCNNVKAMFISFTSTALAFEFSMPSKLTCCWCCAWCSTFEIYNHNFNEKCFELDFNNQLPSYGSYPIDREYHAAFLPIDTAPFLPYQLCFALDSPPIGKILSPNFLCAGERGLPHSDEVLLDRWFVLQVFQL